MPNPHIPYKGTPTQSETPRTEEMEHDILAGRYGKPLRAALSLCEALERELTAERAARLEAEQNEAVAWMKQSEDAALLQQAERALAEARRDAGRYKWLRNDERREMKHGEPFICREWHRVVTQWIGEEADAAIDAALAGRGERDAGS